MKMWLQAWIGALVLTVTTLGLAQGPVALPKGHPSIEQLTAATREAPPPAASMPSVKGSITIQALTGSAGGAPVVNESVLIELYHQGIVLQKWGEKGDTMLDAAGTVTINNIPLRVPCQVMVTITHNGLQQQALGKDMLAPESPHLIIPMKVYEPTDQNPAWTINMRHVIVQWTAGAPGVQVIEMLFVNNPSDRAWLGEFQGKQGGGRVTMTLPLPTGAVNVQLAAGFDETATTIAKDRIVNQAPLFPGQTEFRVLYILPAPGGKANLAITAPHDIEQMRVFVPADAVAVTATGLEGGAPKQMGQGMEAVRPYRASKLKAGQSVSLAFSGIVAAPVSAHEHEGDTPAGHEATVPGGTGGAGGAEQDSSGFSAKNLAIVGALVLGLCGLGVFFLRKPRTPTQGTR